MCTPASVLQFERSWEIILTMMHLGFIGAEEMQCKDKYTTSSLCTIWSAGTAANTHTQTHKYAHIHALMANALTHSICKHASHICVCGFTGRHTHWYSHIYSHSCTHTCIYTYTHICTRAQPRMHKHMHAHTQGSYSTHRIPNVYTCMHIHTLTNMYWTHTHTHSRLKAHCHMRAYRHIEKDPGSQRTTVPNRTFFCNSSFLLYFFIWLNRCFVLLDPEKYFVFTN